MPFECDMQAKRLARYQGEQRQKGLLGEQSSRLVARAEPPHARHPRLLARHAAVRQQSTGALESFTGSDSWLHLQSSYSPPETNACSVG